MTHVAELWRGEVSLPKAGWLYGLMGSLVLIGPLMLLAGLGPTPSTKPLLLALSGAVLLYAAFISVAIWRSAGNYRGAWVWRLLAKGSVLFVALQVVAGVGLS